MVSIILVSFNVPEVTIACIESIKSNVSCPVEIIVVDNASSRQTIDALEAMDGISLIKNSENLGFPAACNEGLAAAKGDYIWFLNNDTIIPHGSLELMLSVLDSDEKIGMVGPVTNRISGIQQIPVDYEGIDLPAIESFAEKRRREFGDLTESVTRLVGFSMLLRKSELDVLGGLDESMGIGTFEDDDLSLRLMANGYKLVIAKGAFIHHMGGASFSEAGGVPTRGDENQRIVSARYGLTVPDDVVQNKKVISFVDAHCSGTFVDVRCGGGANALYARSKGLRAISVEFDEKQHKLAASNTNECILAGGSCDVLRTSDDVVVAFERQIDLKDVEYFFDAFVAKAKYVLFTAPYVTEIDGKLIAFRDSWNEAGSAPEYCVFDFGLLMDYMLRRGYRLIEDNMEDIWLGFFARNAVGRLQRAYGRDDLVFKRYTAVYALN